jgi:hypothetical protein
VANLGAGATAPFSVTLRNDTGTQQLGSANITVPKAFTVVASPAAAVDHGTVLAPQVTSQGTLLQLRNLMLAPNASATLTLTLQMPCAAGSYGWQVNAKQSNDYKGTGNDLGPLTASLTTTVSGACALRFVAEPAGARTNTTIRADAWQPASSRLVAVEAIDGSANPQRLSWFTGPISLSQGPTTGTSGSGRLAGAGPVPAAAGLAVFPDLQIDAAGTYALQASTTASGFADGHPLSGEFEIVDVVSDCTRRSCSAALGTTTIASTSGDDSGFLVLSGNIAGHNEPMCVGYAPPAASAWYEFQLVPAGTDTTIERDSTITLRYTKAQMKSVPGQLQVCFAAPLRFTAKDPGAQPFDFDGDPANAAEGFVGQLLDCPALRTFPCVAGRAPLGGGAASITFFVPAAWGADPRFH